jgi:hypothetical protein
LRRGIFAAGPFVYVSEETPPQQQQPRAKFAQGFSLHRVNVFERIFGTIRLSRRLNFHLVTAAPH